MEIDIISPAIISGLLINSDNEFCRARGRQTARLWQPIAHRVLRELEAVKYGIDPYRYIFHGHNPLNNSPIQVVFNEPAPMRSSILWWNTLLQSWMFSSNAGLTWERCALTEEILNKTDCMCDEPKYNGC